ncbi:unnamed protein product [Caenorhabditis brenneri]
MISRCIPFFRKKSSKHEKNSDSYQPNLSNMPKVVMEEVLKNLDFRSIFRLRKVCHDLRFTIDEIRPVIHFDKLCFNLPLTTKSIESYLENKWEDYRNFYMELNKPRTGCVLGWRHIEIKDAETLLKNANMVLDSLNINLLFWIENPSEYIEKKEEDLRDFYESMKLLLKNASQPLKTRRIELYGSHLSQAAGILKLIDPKSLKSISIVPRSQYIREESDTNFSEFESLEQWKNAKELEIYGNYILTPIESFASFKTIKVWAGEIPIEKLNEVKECFLHSTKMKTFIIKSLEISGMENEILSNFGQFDFYDEDFGSYMVLDARRRAREERRTTQKTWTWLKNLPESTENLQITLRIGLEDHIKFSKV